MFQPNKKINLNEGRNITDGNITYGGFPRALNEAKKLAKKDYNKNGKQNEPQPFHGLSPSAEHGEQIKQLLKHGSDDPDTQEIEPQKTTSWQDVNAAAFNEIKKQRMQQQLQQGMMR